ncbi:diguanylate cyclase (GGDEF)-like protein [Paenibacillus phyllosphaerae]|uniref:Diguanylate cyclase (GGDEF)-like protein n=1 Tax=Paenibacillus phyllosphaerae TaxID=274593 RepID=A0A7W5FR04_9BACL|nr:bifunctional diguanylate cyclase/phosphodiesterase [Paenibacillus phyllosphaerae]MBB3113848.1 diguanylate cyclase (GGDEF)-like protein [Paenibacillus phyllosphaerae]
MDHMDHMNHMEGHYNTLTVALSLLIAMAASYSALDLAGKIARVTGKSRKIWLAAGSFVMGVGVWSMHFVGMLAFHLDVNVTYNTAITVLSMVFSIGASYVSFQVTAAVQATNKRRAFAGFIMGTGIIAMHYTGMAAIQKPITITYNPFYWLLSALIAYAASYAALYLFLRLRHTAGFSYWKLLCSVIMGIAICGMHYTGMLATNFSLDYTSVTDTTDMMGSSRLVLLIGVAVATFVILIMSAGIMFFDRTVLERMAYYDALTGLLNRHQLINYFETSFIGKETGFLLFVDLDRFKTINDTLGHDVGDLVIKEIAARLRLTVSGDQTVFRLGGDEFLIASSRGNKEVAGRLAGVVLREIRKTLHVSGHDIQLTASVGASLAPEHGTNRTALLKTADMALYQAKQLGRNQYRLFDEELDRKFIRRMELERDLSRAVAEGELFVMYQPKWDAQTDRISGAEALMRWQHPVLGLISPGEFIPIAEETGLIVPMTRWMLKDVCLKRQAWQEQGIAPFRVSVNMSIRVFERGMLQEMVNEALSVSGLSPELLELEITETIAMHDLPDKAKQLQSLRKLGVTVSMDDFGTGYSSLGNLDELPIDVLKIDQSFVRQSAVHSKQAIISTIIAIAGHLNLEVVAEGVETSEQIEFLLSRGCAIMQGYYYGKPMEAAAMEKWIDDMAHGSQKLQEKKAHS